MASTTDYTTDPNRTSSSPTSENEKKPQLAHPGDGEALSPSRTQDAAVAALALVKAQDVHHPTHWAAWKRWSIVAVYCWLQVFVTLTSTAYVGTEWLIQEKWGGSTQVVTLGQSMFIVGTAVGPAFMGPLS
jgi:hypothetical protein